MHEERKNTKTEKNEFIHEREREMKLYIKEKEK